MKQREVKFFGFALGFLLLDLITKFIFNGKNYFEGSFFSINFQKNLGSAFGMFSSVEFYNMFIWILSLLFLGFILYYRDMFLKDDKLYWFGIFLIAGLLGNTYDRIVFGFVRDFISLKYLFVFNIADVYLTLCALLLLKREFWK